jgi:hypothetical protein
LFKKIAFESNYLDSILKFNSKESYHFKILNQSYQVMIFKTKF